MTSQYASFFHHFQVIVAVIKNLINFNKSLFDGFASIVIPSLIGIAALNSNETIRIVASQASWLGKLAGNTKPITKIHFFFLLFFKLRMRPFSFVFFSHMYAHWPSIWKFTQWFYIGCDRSTKGTDIHRSTSRAMLYSPRICRYICDCLCIIFRFELYIWFERCPSNNLCIGSQRTIGICNKNPSWPKCPRFIAQSVQLSRFAVHYWQLV